MRYRLMATYRGAPYEAGVGPADGAVVLFAACPPPEELGFEPADGYWRKELRLTDIQAVWQSQPVGAFRGERCIVLDDLGDRLHIGYLGHDAYRAEELGYWQVDRGVFELVAARDEVTDIVEERTDYPGAATSGSYTSPPPVLADYSRPTSPAFSASSGPDPLGSPSGFGSLPGRRFPAGSSVALPPAAAGPPLPLEAEAMRAASASASARRDGLTAPGSRDRLAAAGTGALPGGTAVPSNPVPPGGFVPSASSLPPAAPAARPSAPVAPLGPAAPAFSPVSPASLVSPAPMVPSAPDVPPARGAVVPPWTAPARGRRRSAGQRTATGQIFSELASLAAIPASSYSVGEEVDGAMCLLETAVGFEVFSCSAGARHEVRVFSDEESACFYLFGVLAAEAVRTGALAPARGPAAAFAGDGRSRR